MSKHEIRLRRQKLTSRGADRFRNYGAVLQRHEADLRMRKILRVFAFFLVTLIVIILIVILSRVEKRGQPKPDDHPTSSIVTSRPPLRSAL